MVRVYIDSSGLVHRAQGIRNGTPWRPPLDTHPDTYALSSSAIARVEVHRALLRTEKPAIAQELTAHAFIDIDSIAPALTILGAAAALPVQFLKALDAIHVATALAMKADIVLTRDRQMEQACAELGLTTAST